VPLLPATLLEVGVVKVVEVEFVAAMAISTLIY
jgi:hypothetical protein